MGDKRIGLAALGRPAFSRQISDIIASHGREVLTRRHSSAARAQAGTLKLLICNQQVIGSNPIAGSDYNLLVLNNLPTVVAFETCRKNYFTEPFLRHFLGFTIRSRRSVT